MNGCRLVQARFRHLDIGTVQLGPGFMEEVDKGGTQYSLCIKVEVNRKWNETDWETADPRAITFRCEGGYFQQDAQSGQAVREHDLNVGTLSKLEQDIFQAVTGSPKR